MNYRDLDLDARHALMAQSAAEHRTHMERWTTMGRADHPGWAKRAALACSFIAPGTRVVDVGCGAQMYVERHLPAGCHYTPVDVVRHDARTLVVDLNKEPLPAVEADVVVALGVLEYLGDVPGFLKQIRCNAVMSYSPADLGVGKDRASLGWWNHYTAREMRLMLRTAGFRIERWAPFPGNQRLYSLVR